MGCLLLAIMERPGSFYPVALPSPVVLESSKLWASDKGGKLWLTCGEISGASSEVVYIVFTPFP